MHTHTHVCTHACTCNMYTCNTHVRNTHTCACVHMHNTQVCNTHAGNTHAHTHTCTQYTTHTHTRTHYTCTQHNTDTIHMQSKAKPMEAITQLLPPSELALVCLAPLKSSSHSGTLAWCSKSSWGRASNPQPGLTDTNCRT